MLCVSSEKSASRRARCGVDRVAAIQSDRWVPPKLSPSPGAAGRGRFGSERRGAVHTRASAVAARELASTASRPSSRAMQRVRRTAEGDTASRRNAWCGARRSVRRDGGRFPSTRSRASYVLLLLLTRCACLPLLSCAPSQQPVELQISYGGLLMRLKGDARHLAKLTLDSRMYLLIRKIAQ